MIILSMFVGLILLILINVPVAVALGIVGALATVASFGAFALRKAKGEKSKTIHIFSHV